MAISFAFPGPADYPAGIIGDLPNLPAFRGGVALGPMLEAKFGLPVFINNDGDLFAYGEATAGFLPWVNDQLAQAGSPRRFENLVGVTLGTGFGGGIVRRGELLTGDNSMAAEICPRVMRCRVMLLPWYAKKRQKPNQVKRTNSSKTLRVLPLKRSANISTLKWLRSLTA